MTGVVGDGAVAAPADGAAHATVDATDGEDGPRDRHVVVFPGVQEYFRGTNLTGVTQHGMKQKEKRKNQHHLHNRFKQSPIDKLLINVSTWAVLLFKGVLSELKG